MTVYLITNKINGKMYVGQTRYTVNCRWSQHKNCALVQKINTPFYKAIRKYGPESFNISVLDSALSLEELNKKEIQHIDALRKSNSLYNLTNSGSTTARKWTEKEKNSRPKPPVEKMSIKCLNTDKTYGSIKEASKDTGLNYSSICSVINGSKDSIKGFVFEYLNKEKKQKALEKKQKRKTNSANKHSLGRKIVDVSTGQVFCSIKKAAKHYNVSPASIGRFLKEGWGKCHNLNIRYLEV